MILLVIISFVLTVVLLYPFVGFPLSFLRTGDSTDGMYILYAPKNDNCQRVLAHLHDVDHVKWIDVTRLSVMNIPLVDTKSQSTLHSTSKRVTLGNVAAKEAGEFHHRLCETYGFKNKVPHFAVVQNGKIVDSRIGFPNDWF